MKGAGVVIKAVAQECNDILLGGSGASNSAVDVDFVDFVHLVGPVIIVGNILQPLVLLCRRNRRRRGGCQTP